MTDFYRKLTEMQGGLEDLARKIPGLGEMFEAQDWRNADRLLREHLVREFEALLGRFTDAQRRLLEQPGGITHMERAQAITTRLQTFIDRIRTATQGYSGVFDAVKINAETLQHVYTFDNALIGYRDQFATGLDQLASADGADAVSSVLRQLEAVATEANTTFDQRVEAMMGLQHKAV